MGTEKNKEDLNGVFDFVLDGDDLCIFIHDVDVTSAVKKKIGKDAFLDLERSYRTFPEDKTDEFRDYHFEKRSEEAHP